MAEKKVTARRNIEIHAEKWFTDNGYEFSIKKRIMSKTVYVLRKDDAEMEFDIPSGITNAKFYLDACKCLIEDRLRRNKV